MKTAIMNVLGLILFLPATATLAEAQASEYPRVEVFGGFSYLNGQSQARNTFYGGQGSVTLNIHRNLGLTADIGGQVRLVPTTTIRGCPGQFCWEVSTSVDAVPAYEFLVGPRFTVRREHTAMFAHVLAGAVHGLGRTGIDNSFGMGFGGGIDFRAGDRFALRAVQVDYIPNHSANRSFNDVRIGTGVVWKWTER
jgi:hypothetical protein